MNILSVITILLLAGTVMAQSDYGAGPNEWPIPHNIGHTGFSSSTAIHPPFKVNWGVRVPNLISGESGNGPVVAGGKVVLHGHGHQLVCLDTADGAVLWRTSIPEAEFGFRFYPCIADHRVYAVFAVKGNPSANGIRCIDLNTGETLWKRDAGMTGSMRFKDSPQYFKGKVFLHSVRDVNQSTLAQNNYQYKAQVQAWDAATGDTLWSYNVWDSLDAVQVNRAYSNSAYHTSLCVAGDTVYASCGLSNDTLAGTGRTVALSLDGRLLWSVPYHVPMYVGELQYAGDKLLVGAGWLALDARTGALLWYNKADPYGKVSPLMNGKYWNRSYGSVPFARNLSTGASLGVSGKLVSKDGYGSGCNAPRAANGYIFSGFGNPNGPYGLQAPGYLNDYAKHYVWDEQGNPVFWFTSPDSIYSFPNARLAGNSCQGIAIAYDRFYWVSHNDGWVYCYENDTRTVSSFKAICIPETLEQYWPGLIRSVTRYTDGSADTTAMSCLFTSLDSAVAMVRIEGGVYPRNPGTAIVRVSRHGLTDTLRIPVVPSKTLTDTPVFIRRVNFQVSWHPYLYGWLAGDGSPYTPIKHQGFMNANSSTGLRVGNVAGTANTFLLNSFVFSGANPARFRLDAPEGRYIIRTGMGYNVYGVSRYDWTVFGSDTIARKPAGTGNTVCTDTIIVSGDSGINLTVNGYICYLVICSADKGVDICDIADDDSHCSGTGTEINRTAVASNTITAYPNPFNPGTRVRFGLEKRRDLRLVILDIRGKPVRTLASRTFGAGPHTVEWDGRNDAGKSLASGVYMVRLYGKGFEKTAIIHRIE